LIDEKSIQSVKEGKVGFKTFGPENAVHTYQDGHNICFSDLTKNPYEGDLYLNVKPEKFQLMIEPTGVITGADVMALHGSSLYQVRRPIEFSNLAIS
jgi:hypothetical protein